MVEYIQGKKGDQWLQCDLCDDFICPKCKMQNISITLLRTISAGNALNNFIYHIYDAKFEEISLLSG